jgi:ribosomal protein S8
MPEFTSEVDIDPSEFIESCSKKEIDRLVEILVEDGYIQSDQETKSTNNGVRRPNINDQTFWESLERLAKCRHLLSIEEENFINNLSNKFKYIR